MSYLLFIVRILLFIPVLIVHLVLGAVVSIRRLASKSLSIPILILHVAMSGGQLGREERDLLSEASGKWRIGLIKSYEICFGLHRKEPQTPTESIVNIKSVLIGALIVLIPIIIFDLLLYVGGASKYHILLITAMFWIFGLQISVSPSAFVLVVTIISTLFIGIVGFVIWTLWLLFVLFAFSYELMKVSLGSSSSDASDAELIEVVNWYALLLKSNFLFFFKYDSLPEKTILSAEKIGSIDGNSNQNEAQILTPGSESSKGVYLLLIVVLVASTGLGPKSESDILDQITQFFSKLFVYLRSLL